MIKRALLGLGLAFSLTLSALAVVSQTIVGNVAYSVLNTDVNVYTTTAFTAARTWTLPYAAGTCIGQSCQPAANQLTIADLAGAITYQNTLTIAPQSGDTINGNAANVTLSAAGARAYLVPTSGSNWAIETVGDYVTSGICPGSGTTATVTITIATPGVVTWTAHGLTGACPVVLTTSGALPTGLTASTTYWVVPSSITTNTFQLATSVANALAGTAIATTGTQSGTQTGTAGAPLSTATAANVTGVALTQGTWTCYSSVSRVLGASTSVTIASSSNSATSATMGTQGSNAFQNIATAANVMGATGSDTKIANDRVTATGAQNLYLVAKDTFSVSTNVAYGALTCRRII